MATATLLPHPRADDDLVSIVCSGAFLAVLASLRDGLEDFSQIKVFLEEQAAQWRQSMPARLW